MDSKTPNREPGYYWVKVKTDHYEEWMICDYLGEGVWFHVGECINGKEMEIDETRIVRPSERDATIAELRKELEEVYAAGAPMAANQCLYGIRGDEGGNSYCTKVDELNKLLLVADQMITLKGNLPYVVSREVAHHTNDEIETWLDKIKAILHPSKERKSRNGLEITTTHPPKRTAPEIVGKALSRKIDEIDALKTENESLRERIKELETSKSNGAE